ncbi:MAG: two-component sensor histidine kinase [Candidatus Aminicenantes bacterium]|nr:MAG: two-component sensor histidine kinase [Candidatus Aminicenantes bacterium]
MTNIKPTGKQKKRFKVKPGERSDKETLDRLKETQQQLVQLERMASLGQLTAGIAHEIKNPLNFVINFADLSRDLVKELQKEIQPGKINTIKEILNQLEQNVEKIKDHGKRIDSIVKGMLLHSRGKQGEFQLVDLNALLEENTILVYHSMRALDRSFHLEIQTDFDETIGKIKIVPQDFSRAFLNIAINACYSVNEKRKKAPPGFSPLVLVKSRNLGENIQVRVWDNGSGIPDRDQDKIFTPFFTTKPAGTGTGLGLSIAYDLITGEHNGTLEFETREGESAEFIITIPIRTFGDR